MFSYFLKYVISFVTYCHTPQSAYVCRELGALDHLNEAFLKQWVENGVPYIVYMRLSFKQGGVENGVP